MSIMKWKRDIAKIIRPTVYDRTDSLPYRIASIRLSNSLRRLYEYKLKEGNKKQ